MARTKDFSFVTKEAKSAEGMNIRDTILFHYFNPRGLVAAQKRIDDAIWDFVNAGKAATGALFAYGSLDDYHYNRMVGFAKRKPDAITLRVAIRLYEERNARAQSYVASLRKKYKL